MKIQKFNEMTNYKEYDEYANIDINIIKNWTLELDKIDTIINDIKHDIHRYNDFIREYVVFVGKMFFIPSSIELHKNDSLILFNDIYNGHRISMVRITDIKSLNDIANEDQKLFLELYNFYIIKKEAPYMDVFGKEEYKHIIDAETKYNL
jgi:hypothetical protein